MLITKRMAMDSPGSLILLINSKLWAGCSFKRAAVRILCNLLVCHTALEQLVVIG